MNPSRPTIYLPGLPSLASEDLSLYNVIHASRVDLVTQLSGAGCRVEDIDGQHPWLKTMLHHAETSDAFLFPPMASLPESHPRYQREAAQRWFEFFSLVTGVHIGDLRKYGRNGVSKPCVVMDPDGQWSLALELLHDLHIKGMFTSRVEDIIQVVEGEGSDYQSLNKKAVGAVVDILEQRRGKLQRDVPARYPQDYEFAPFRHEMRRHPFGIAIFGSATTPEPSYIEAVENLADMAGQRGWRMVTGAGTDGCLGAADRGFARGKRQFNAQYPEVMFRPAHVGVSTQPILRLEGPPADLDQLIITNNIYDRMEIMIRGKKSSNSMLRARDATKVLFVAPGGTGTLHEFATLMQLATNGSMMTGRKVVLLDFPSHIHPEDGFWKLLIKTGKKLGFDSMFDVVKSPEEAIAYADKVYLQWLERHEEFQGQLPHPLFKL